MEKLTKKEFIQALKNSEGYFITSVFNISIEKIIENLDSMTEDEIKRKSIFRIKDIIEKSNHIESVKEDNSISFRYFYGSNEFYQHNNYLLHVNTQDSSTCTMINI